MDIEKQSYDPPHKPSKSCSSFIIILNKFLDIFLLYIIYILLCLLILLSPCLFIIIKFKSRLKTPIQILLLLLFSLILIPIAYVFIAIYLTIYFIIIFILQTVRNLKHYALFCRKKSKINPIENSMKSLETSVKLLENPIEKSKIPESINEK